MAESGVPIIDFTEADLDFLVSTGAADTRDKERLAQILRADADFRNAFLEDEKVVQKVIGEKGAYLRISPRLYFEVLLRKARKELARARHTVEAEGGAKKIAVFDADRVVALLSRPEILGYLAEMLASFSRVNSYSIAYRVRPGDWRTIRFNDADVESLLRLMEYAGEEFRVHFYKRIADIYLFVLGVFPECVRVSERRLATGWARAPFVGTPRRSMEEYEEEGKRYYRLAAQLATGGDLPLGEVFQALEDSFHLATKPLDFIARNYIALERRALFESPN